MRSNYPAAESTAAVRWGGLPAVSPMLATDRSRPAQTLPRRLQLDTAVILRVIDKKHLVGSTSVAEAVMFLTPAKRYGRLGLFLNPDSDVKGREIASPLAKDIGRSGSPEITITDLLNSLSRH